MKIKMSRSYLSTAMSRLGFAALAVILSLGFAFQTAAQADAGKLFASPENAADALIAAAETFDEAAFKEILGPNSYDIVHSGEPNLDKEVASEFARLGRIKRTLTADKMNRRLTILEVGDDDWPFPIPLIKVGRQWRYDTAAGRQEILYRRVGRNELDAIDICRGYVTAQHEYASEKRDGATVNQYAQRVISTPGKQDGLVWRNPDGSLGGPISEEIGQAIQKGYADKSSPYHGYFFKILKGQGASAPIGKLDFVVNNAMIGGFALIAFPAHHGLTGVKTFMVSHDGVVYEKDLGPNTLELAKAIELFEPDRTWSPVPDDE